MALSLRRNAAWALLGQVVFATCHWAGVVVLGRLGGPEELGRYGLALAVVTPIMLFAGLQMRELQVVDATERYSYRDYFSVRLASTICAGMVILAIAGLGYTWEVAVPIVLMGLARGFENLSEIHYGLAQRHRRFDLVSRSLMLRGFAGLVALGVGYYLTMGLGVALLAMAAAWGLVWWLFDNRMTRPWRDRSRRDWGREARLRPRLDLARLGLPLGIAFMFTTIDPNVPRYVIEAVIGLESLGLFVAMAHFVVAGRMILNAACQAASPRLADLHAAGDRVAFSRLLLRLMALGVLSGVVGLVVAIAFGSELLSLIYGPQFADAAGVFPWIMLVGAVLYVQTPLGYGLTALHQFKVQPLIFGLAVAINAAGCLVLIPRYGLWGATLPWLGSAVCQFVLSVAVHWHCMSRSIREAGDTGRS
jgi:O-antigen/teichoic acid export membrane protein